MIHRSGATTFPEILRMVPGLQIAHIDSNKWVVGSRGFGDRFSGKLLVQVDGRTVYNAVNSGVYWDAQDLVLEDIERVEVIRDPGATVWGANAVNGVVNIITKDSKETQGGLLTGDRRSRLWRCAASRRAWNWPATSAPACLPRSSAIPPACARSSST